MSDTTREKIANIKTGNKCGYKGEFSTLLNNAKHRKRGFDLTEEYLQSIWTGKCSITGIDIYNSKNKNNTLFSASLDRIDSSLGYIKGNVIIVSYKANRIKQDASIHEIEKVALWLRRQEKMTNQVIFSSQSPVSLIYNSRHY